MLRRFLAHNPLPWRLLLSLIALLSLLGLVYALTILTTAERQLLFITTILVGLFILFSSTFSIRYWKWRKWVLFFLYLLVGLGYNVLFIESQSGAGDYIWTIYRGFPIEWLRQSIGFDGYRPDAFVHQVIAQHPEQLSTDIYWNHFILVLIFYTHLAIIITTLCGRLLRGLLAQPELFKGTTTPDGSKHP